jgi:hypothetical protein
MKNIITKINESLSAEDGRNLDSIIRLAKVNVNEPFFFMCRIPKKKEFHIYSCNGKDQLEDYYEQTKKKPLEFGRFQAIRQDKEELLKITKLYTFRKDHYKTIEEN